MISYAQNFEDVTLWRALRDVTNGRYVDVGALHPEIDSVTKWFYDQGWSGINLEPVPEMFAVIEAARPRDINIRAAAGAAPGVADMAVVPDSMGLSSLDISAVTANVAFSHNLVQVEVRPLRDVLEPFTGQDIHFLKVDAEGTEHDVLLGMDFERFRPWVVLVEATEPLSQTATAEKWEDILVAANYQHAYFDGLNEFYVAAERSELASKLAVPPNVFDHFELAATVRERTGREELQRLYRSATDENHRLQGEISRRDTELAAVREQLANVSSELNRTQATLMTTEAQLAAARDEIDRERRRLEQSHQRIDELISQVRGSEAAIVSLSEQLSELAAELRKGRELEGTYKKQLEQVLSSRSFRWLAPMRRMRAVLLPHRQ
jgi:FkbM family methyltransferase